MILEQIVVYCEEVKIFYYDCKPQKIPADVLRQIKKKMYFFGGKYSEQDGTLILSINKENIENLKNLLKIIPKTSYHNEHNM